MILLIWWDQFLSCPWRKTWAISWISWILLKKRKFTSHFKSYKIFLIFKLNGPISCSSGIFSLDLQSWFFSASYPKSAAEGKAAVRQQALRGHPSLAHSGLLLFSPPPALCTCRPGARWSRRRKRSTSVLPWAALLSDGAQLGFPESPLLGVFISSPGDGDTPFQLGVYSFCSLLTLGAAPSLFLLSSLHLFRSSWVRPQRAPCRLLLTWAQV